MSSADQRARLLRRCSNGPRTLHALTCTEEDALLTASIRRWITRCCAEGLLESIEGEGYMTTEAGLAQIARDTDPTSIASSRTYCAATMPAGSLKLPKWGRDTGNERILSKGLNT